jgi:hypothetical protein
VCCGCWSSGDCADRHRLCSGLELGVATGSHACPQASVANMARSFDVSGPCERKLRARSRAHLPRATPRQLASPSRPREDSPCSLVFMQPSKQTPCAPLRLASASLAASRSGEPWRGVKTLLMCCRSTISLPLVSGALAAGERHCPASCPKGVLLRNLGEQARPSLTSCHRAAVRCDLYQ